MLRGCVAFTFSVALAAFAGAACAAELCQAPGPPPDQSLQPVVPVKPATPPCVKAAQASGCRQSVIKAYNASVDDYNVAMAKFNLDGNAYIDALNHWARSGVDYANCEVQRLNRQVMQ